MTVQNKIWFEKYRPSKLDELIVPNRIREQLNGFIESKNIPNLLFYSPGGMGKTSTAKILINELKMDFIEINGSIDRGIDTIRDTIVKFAGTGSLINNDQNKCIFVTEADGFTEDAKNSMKNLIEKFSNNIRFIFDTNYVDKLSQPIRSRCVEIDFNFNKSEYPDLMKQMLQRSCSILEDNNIEFNKKDVADLIKKRFPDMRKIVNDLQKSSVSGKFIPDSLDTGEIFDSLIKELCNRDYEKIRSIVRSISDPENIYLRMYSQIDNIIEKNNLGQAILIIADYQHRSRNCVSTEINLLACLTEFLSKGIKFKCK